MSKYHFLKYRVRVFQIFLDLCRGEYGVAFTNSPQHPFKGFYLYPLNNPRNKTVGKIKHNKVCNFLSTVCTSRLHAALSEQLHVFLFEYLT